MQTLLDVDTKGWDVERIGPANQRQLKHRNVKAQLQRQRLFKPMHPKMCNEASKRLYTIHDGHREGGRHLLALVSIDQSASRSMCKRHRL